jgi:hypothetical protein
VLSGVTAPAVSGLAVGIAFIILFSIMPSLSRSYEPRISEEQAANMVASHLKEKWNGCGLWNLYT